MENNKRTTLLWAFLLIFALALAACGDDMEEDPSVIEDGNPVPTTMVGDGEDMDAVDSDEPLSDNMADDLNEEANDDEDTSMEDMEDADMSEEMTDEEMASDMDSDEAMTDEEMDTADMDSDEAMTDEDANMAEDDDTAAEIDADDPILDFSTPMTMEEVAMMGTVATDVRSSDVVGAELIYRQLEDFGEVHDVLLTETGEIAYVLIGFGNGFNYNEYIALRMDEGGLAALPGDAFAVVGQMDDDGLFDSYQVLFIGTLEQIADAPVVGDDYLENDFMIPSEGIGIEMDDMMADTFIRASGLNDLNLVSRDGDDLGEIEEVVLNMESSTVRYAIADVGGFLGLGETATALPWEKLMFNMDDEGILFDDDQALLENAPNVDDDIFEDGMFKSDWSIDFDSYWGM